MSTPTQTLAKFTVCARGAVAAHDDGWDSYGDSVSLGLRAIRAAAALRRLSAGEALTTGDRDVLAHVSDALRYELRLLRHEEDELSDAASEVESAFAGLALKALPDPGRDLDRDAATAVAELDGLLKDVDAVAADDVDSAARSLADLEKIFVTIWELASRGTDHTGELLEPAPQPL